MPEMRRSGEGCPEPGGRACDTRDKRPVRDIWPGQPVSGKRPVRDT